MRYVMSKILAFIDGTWEEVWEGPSHELSAEAKACYALGYKIRTCLS